MRHLRGEVEGAREIMEPCLLKTILKFNLLTSSYGGKNVWPAGWAAALPCPQPLTQFINLTITGHVLSVCRHSPGTFCLFVLHMALAHKAVR